MPNNTQVLTERVELLIANVGEVKEMVARLAEQVRVLEKDGYADQIRAEAKLEAAHHRLDEHEKALTHTGKVLPDLVTASRVGTYLGGALVLSVMALIWALITGQAHLSFVP
jgi:hypothetical protein